MYTGALQSLGASIINNKIEINLAVDGITYLCENTFLNLVKARS